MPPVELKMTKEKMPQSLSSRIRTVFRMALSDERLCLWWLLAALYLCASMLTRVFLAGVAIAQGQATLGNIPAMMAVGLVFDVVTALNLFALFALYLVVIPGRIYNSRGHRWLLAGMFSMAVFGLIYLGAVEYFFFDEFNSRFNFVAVEYLIYPHEVFVNIWQSYPVARVMLAALALTVVAIWFVRKPLLGNRAFSGSRRIRFVMLAILALAIGLSQATLDVTSGRYSDNRVMNELAMNGVYSFFNAALNSELDYHTFYLSLPDDDVNRRLRGMLATRNAAFLPGAGHIERHVSGDAPPRPLNVVVLLEESLGAEYVGVYGDKRGLTPVLDSLAKQSMLFTRAYATGTRTVRGMEAVSASYPPVPGESIIKRPHNEGMFNWSTVMAKNGYVSTFIYGGFGTFDNMNYFFSSNGYRVVDRTDMDAPQFANIWGVSDEDLFRHAVREFDEQHGRREKIFSIVMTTSNHKPFTFPAGVEGVPVKGGGREAGIRYADYAIGRFFDMAKAKPWFDDTLFVVIADHGARAYGREDIPIKTYGIPLMLYSPKHITPARVDTLTSQIDVAPTVLGVLNFTYDSTFFGIDVFKDKHPDRAIPLNHNRDVALFDGRNLFEIGFRKTSAQNVYDPVTHSQTPAAVDAERSKDTIAVFQKAFELYSKRQYRIAGHD